MFLLSVRIPKALIRVLSMAGACLAATSTDVRAESSYVVPGKEVVVSFPRSPMSRAAARSIDRLRSPSYLTVAQVKGSYSVGVASLAGRVVPLSKQPKPVNRAEVAALCDEIRRANPGVDLICEANTLLYAFKTPDDTFYSQQYGMTQVDAPTAWDTTTGSSSVIVAVVDSGVDYLHPDLSANIAVNAGETPSNGIDDDGNGKTDDYYGYDFVNGDGNPMDDNEHGTHCAGTVGARGNNARGVVGVNWTVGILPIKALDSTGSGFLSDVAAGIDYAVDRGASVLSLSLGGPEDSATLENAISNAERQGVLVVVAAGNDGSNNDITPSYPASSTSPNVLAVAASNSTDHLASFSNFGATSVDVAAPGVAILSTLPSDSYGNSSGTSMATPCVAGLAALLLSANSTLTYSQIKDIITNTVDQVADLSGKVASGGRVNAARAVSSALTVPTPTPTGRTSSNTLTLSIERARRRSYLYGEIRDTNGVLVSGERVTLFCNKKRIASRVSDAEGYYEFARKRPAAPVKCFVRDSLRNRSPSRTLR